MGSRGMMRAQINPFTTPLEAGLRSLWILEAARPRALDLQSLVQFDYLTVHSGDMAGPPSLHAPVPLRVGEILVRRELIERGLRLMMGRGLIDRCVNDDGFSYVATELATTFLHALEAPYSRSLQSRAAWVIDTFSELGAPELRERIAQMFRPLQHEFDTLGPSSLLVS